MKLNSFIKIALLFLPCTAFAQSHTGSGEGYFEKDSLIVVHKDASKGFYNDYLLFIPKGLKRNNETFLLVEPNNSGRLSDSIKVHTESAIRQACVSSIGNNISTELKIPLLVPIFPRPESSPLVYTHALDRDVMLSKEKGLKRLDLQLVNMITDARNRLKALNIPVENKILLNGFSASATFANRFSFMHPELIKAVAMGGFNGELIFPVKKLHNVNLNYPLGVNDFEEIFGRKFDKEAYLKIQQFIFMGELDDNDAVQFDDAYSNEERYIINSFIGDSVQKRWKFCQKMYLDEKLNIIFTTYENVGHWTTSKINLDIILFFNKFIINKNDSGK